MSSEMETLKEKLAQEIRKGQQAAAYGLQLVEENKLLIKSIEKQKCDYESLLEDLRQQVHTLTGRVDSKCHVAMEQASELDNTREIIENLKKKVNRQETEFQHKVAELIASGDRLEFECAEKGCTLLTLTKKIEILETQLAESTNNLHYSLSESITNSFDQKILSENQTLLDEKQELIAKLLEVEGELHQSQEKNKKLVQLREELQEALADRDSELSSCSMQIRSAHEENEDLQAELESLKMEQLDVKKRGNSLFAEVEDNRKVLEDEVKTLRKQKHILLDKDNCKTQEIFKLKHQVAVLRCTADQQADIQYVQKLDQALSQARGEVQELSLKLKQSEAKWKSVEGSVRSPTEIKSLPTPTTSNLKAESYSFMHTMMKERDDKIVELQAQLDSIRFAKTALSNKLMVSDRQFYQADKKSRALQSELNKIKLDLEEVHMKDKPETKPVSKSITVVERIPGFKAANSLPTSSQSASKSSKKAEISKTMQELMKKEYQVSDNKENTVSESNTIPTFITEESDLIQNKRSTKTVTIVNSESIEEDNSGEKLLKKSRAMAHKGGWKANEPCVLVSSEDACDPADCKQQ